MRRPHIQVADRLEDVTGAWRLVYQTYCRTELIDPNPYGIYTVPQAVWSESAVFCGKVEGVIAYTMTAYHDGPQGLPLDAVYPDELNQLRRDGRSLLEVVLVADSRREITRQLRTLLELMRYATYFGLHGGSRDAVVGVHPRHAPFYQRLLGFQPLGAVREHPGVKGAAVTLLHLDWNRLTTGASPPSAIATFMAQPLDDQTFTSAYRFASEDLSQTVVGRYLAYRQSESLLTSA